MLKKVFLVLAAISLVACGSTGAVRNNSNAASVGNSATAGSVKVMRNIPYKKGSKIALNIRQECKITEQLSEFTQVYGEDRGIDVVRVPRVTSKDKGQVLKMEITDAVSQGNAFIGHRKYTAIEGSLYKDGKKVSTFTAARFSGGGFFGAYKGSCSVLGRTVKALGEDVAMWLAAPVDGAHLGDAMF